MKHIDNRRAEKNSNLTQMIQSYKNHETEVLFIPHECDKDITE